MNDAADRHPWRALGLCMLTAAVLWPFWPLSASTQPDQPARRVLVLQSYHKGFSWTDDVQRGIETVLEGSGETGWTFDRRFSGGIRGEILSPPKAGEKGRTA